MKQEIFTTAAIIMPTDISHVYTLACLLLYVTFEIRSVTYSLDHSSLEGSDSDWITCDLNQVVDNVDDSLWSCFFCEPYPIIKIAAYATACAFMNRIVCRFAQIHICCCLLAYVNQNH